MTVNSLLNHIWWLWPIVVQVHKFIFTYSLSLSTNVCSTLAMEMVHSINWRFTFDYAITDLSFWHTPKLRYVKMIWCLEDKPFSLFSAFSSNYKETWVTTIRLFPPTIRLFPLTNICFITFQVTLAQNMNFAHGWLDFNVPFLHKYGYIGEKR